MYEPRLPQSPTKKIVVELRILNRLWKLVFYEVQFRASLHWTNKNGTNKMRKAPNCERSIENEWYNFISYLWFSWALGPLPLNLVTITTRRTKKANGVQTHRGVLYLNIRSQVDFTLPVLLSIKGFPASSSDASKSSMTWHVFCTRTLALRTFIRVNNV